MRRRRWRDYTGGAEFAQVRNVPGAALRLCREEKGRAPEETRPDASGRGPGALTNISSTGCYIEGAHGPVVGDVVETELSVPGRFTVPLKALVARVKQGEGFGLRFRGLSDTQRLLLERAVWHLWSMLEHNRLIRESSPRGGRAPPLPGRLTLNSRFPSPGARRGPRGPSSAPLDGSLALLMTAHYAHRRRRNSVDLADHLAYRTPPRSQGHPAAVANLVAYNDSLANQPKKGKETTCLPSRGLFLGRSRSSRPCH